MLKVVFMGTPDFSVPALVALHQQTQIVGVYTQPDRRVGRGLELKFSSVKKKAIELNLPIFQPQKLSQKGEFEKLKALLPDVIVVVAFGQILKKNVLDLPKLGCVNIHSSLLPRWRGAAPIQWAILEGDLKSGITTMHMSEGLDEGDVLLQSETNISSIDTAGSLHDRLSKMSAPLIIETLRGLEKGTLRGVEQDHSKVTFAKKLNKQMQWLDASQKNASDLDRQIRALNPWPGTSVFIEELGRLKIHKACLRSDIEGKNSEIFEKSGMILLGTKNGSIELQKIQWDGKKAIDTNGFLNGLIGKGISLPLKTKMNQD